jgi:phenylalanyl-tRNA synthetase beta chain
MKISLKWLKSYVPLDLPPAELAGKITMAGTEVSHIDIKGGWHDVFIGEIVDIKPHPSADRLRLATVSLGSERETVVCGAPNLRLGDKVAFARTGAELIDGHTGKPSILKSAMIRGISSSGMVCSERELGLSDEHEGILVLPHEAALGKSLSDYLGDVIFDLEVTPNRPDLLSVLGVAHEVAALTSTEVTEPGLDYPTAGGPIETQVSVIIEDAGLCPRYSASLVTGIAIGESPAWMKERLAASGIRSINNIVDITNYVMLEYGQPLHSFDFDKIKNGTVIIRPASAGEQIITLDGASRILPSGSLVIADAEGPIAVAGVMGGAATEVNVDTVNILLESASFKPASIHRTASSLKLASEASQRFERGISPKLTLPALRRATQLLVEICGGTAAQGIIDSFPGHKDQLKVQLSINEIKRILGLDLGMEKVERILSLLGLSFWKTDTESFTVSPPYWRSDIRLAVDVIEELGRIQGYDSIPFSRLSGTLPQFLPAPALGLKQETRRILKGLGFSELITYSYCSEALLKKSLNSTALNPVPLRLRNPMNPDQECMRTSLRGNLLQALASNIRREEGQLYVFELGRIYLARENDVPEEPEMLCALLTLSGQDKRFHGRTDEVDFYDAKGAMQSLMNELRIKIDLAEGDDPGLKPGANANIISDGLRIGSIGEIHQEVARCFDLPQGVFMFEVNMSAVLPLVHQAIYTPVKRFPPVQRDLALVVGKSVTNQGVLGIINKYRMVSKVHLFDVYSGKQVHSGKKSLAYSLTFQSPDHTLNDAEVDGVLKAMVKELSARLGAAIRD